MLIIVSVPTPVGSYSSPLPRLFQIMIVFFVMKNMFPVQWLEKSRAFWIFNTRKHGEVSWFRCSCRAKADFGMYLPARWESVVTDVDYGKKIKFSTLEEYLLGSILDSVRLVMCSW